MKSIIYIIKGDRSEVEKNKKNRLNNGKNDEKRIRVTVTLTGEMAKKFEELAKKWHGETRLAKSNAARTALYAFIQSNGEISFLVPGQRSMHHYMNQRRKKVITIEEENSFNFLPTYPPIPSSSNNFNTPPNTVSENIEMVYGISITAAGLEIRRELTSGKSEGSKLFLRMKALAEKSEKENTILAQKRDEEDADQNIPLQKEPPIEIPIV